MLTSRYLLPPPVFHEDPFVVFSFHWQRSLKKLHWLRTAAGKWKYGLTLKVLLRIPSKRQKSYSIIIVSGMAFKIITPRLKSQSSISLWLLLLVVVMITTTTVMLLECYFFQSKENRRPTCHGYLSNFKVFCGIFINKRILGLSKNTKTSSVLRYDLELHFIQTVVCCQKSHRDWNWTTYLNADI